MKAKNNIIKWEKGQVAIKRNGKVKCYYVKSSKLSLHPSNWAISDMEISERIFNGPDCYHWREVFAWLPVKTIRGKYVWFRKIYKQRCWVVWGKGFHMEPEVEYAELFDVLTMEHE